MRNETEDRAYQEGITSPGVAVTTVATTRQSIQAGVQFSGLAARLPGGLFRLDGGLTVSSFIGSDTSRAVVSVPLQIDGERGKWLLVYRTRGAEGNVALAFKGHIQASAGGSSVAVYVRVD